MGKASERAKKLADWYWTNRTAILARQKQKRSTPEYKQHAREYYQRNKLRLNERQKERRIERKLEQLSRAKANGLVRWRYDALDKRQKTCFICGGTQNLVAHHPNYSMPDLVVTLCSPCHRKVHSDKIILTILTKTCPICQHVSYSITSRSQF